MLSIFRTSQTKLYYGGVGLSLVLSASGILWAVFVSKKCADGQRGGAIATAAAFFILFLRRKYGDAVFQTIFKVKRNAALTAKKKIQRRGILPVFTNDELSWLIIGTLERSNVEADEQWLQNLVLFAASAIGTFAWGFGDVVASWFCKCK